MPSENKKKKPSIKENILVLSALVVVGIIGLVIFSIVSEKEQQDRKGRSENQYQQDRYIQCLDSAKAGIYGSVLSGKEYCWEKLGKYK